MEFETDYLVVGAGAGGMAFTDALIASSDAEVVVVDRRDRPGGHWNDDYQFVRLHQPSALYGVASRTLGHDRIDESGINAGFYERATAAEICDYYGRVLDEDFLPSGQVRFFGMHEHVGTDADGHRLRSRVTGHITTVRARRRLVDATYMESSLPSTHTPAFTVESAAVVVTPNELVDVDEPASGFTIVGAGKTSMDACCWLIEHGVDPDTIRWIRPRDAWTADRASIQPLRLVRAFAEYVAAQNEVCARAESLDELYPALEDRGVFHRLDPDVEPTFNRGATLCEAERVMLREVGNVVRLGKVHHVGADRIDLDKGTIPNHAGHVVVDCTAAGLASRPDRRVYDPDRITIQWIQAGIAPFERGTHRVRRGEPRGRHGQEPAVSGPRLLAERRRRQLRRGLAQHPARVPRVVGRARSRGLALDVPPQPLRQCRSLPRRSGDRGGLRSHGDRTGPCNRQPAAAARGRRGIRSPTRSE